MFRFLRPSDQPPPPPPPPLGLTYTKYRSDVQILSIFMTSYLFQLLTLCPSVIVTQHFDRSASPLTQILHCQGRPGLCILSPVLGPGISDFRHSPEAFCRNEIRFCFLFLLGLFIKNRSLASYLASILICIQETGKVR